MSKPFTNPFFEADMSKMFDMSKMMGGMDMSKMFDMSKIMSDYKMPGYDVEAIISLQRKNAEAIAALSQSTYETMTALWRRQADGIRQAMEEMTQTIQVIMACPTPEAKAIKQAEVSKAAMDKYIANLRDTSETIAKCNTQAMETLGARLNESLDEMTGMVKSATSANRAAA